jgi:hypothetical protein
MGGLSLVAAGARARPAAELRHAGRVATPCVPGPISREDKSCREGMAGRWYIG